MAKPGRRAYTEDRGDFNLYTDHNLCVLTWGGMGPEPWDGYLLELDCKGAEQAFLPAEFP